MTVMAKERADQTAENWRVRNDKARFGERALTDKPGRVPRQVQRPSWRVVSVSAQ